MQNGIVLSYYCQGKTENSKETNSHTSRQCNCTEVHAKRYMETDIQNASGHTGMRKTRRHTGRDICKDTTVNWQQTKRQRDVQADMKTWMLTKCRQTTELDEKNRRVGR
jgi:hypothetical protein